MSECVATRIFVDNQFALYTFSSVSQSALETMFTTPSLTKQQTRGAKGRVYDFTGVKKSKKWLRNILTEKSDTDSSDAEEKASDNREGCSPELLKEMKRLYDMHIKVKLVVNGSSDATLCKHSNSPLLDHGTLSTMSNATVIGNNTSSLSPTRTKKTSKSVSKTCRKSEKRKTEPSFSPAVSVSGTTNASVSPIIPPFSEVSQSPSITSVSSNQNAQNVDSFMTESFLTESKRMKLEHTMLDEIPYDATLPDEILQSESSANDSEPAPSCTPSMSDDINFCSHLPDDVYDTEGSCTSLLSQCLSQPAKSLSGVATLTHLKCLTAPTTPAGSPPSTPSSLVLNPSTVKTIKRSSKKFKKTSPEKAMAMKRRKIWINIARKDVIRAQKQRLSNHKDILTNCKKMASWCQKEWRKNMDHSEEYFEEEDEQDDQQDRMDKSNSKKKLVVKKRKKKLKPKSNSDEP